MFQELLCPSSNRCIKTDVNKLCFEFVKVYQFKFCLVELTGITTDDLQLKIYNYMDRADELKKFLNSRKKKKTKMESLSFNNNDSFPTLGNKNLF